MDGQLAPTGVRMKSIKFTIHKVEQLLQVAVQLPEIRNIHGLILNVSLSILLK